VLRRDLDRRTGVSDVMVKARRHRDERDECHRNQGHGDRSGEAGEEVVKVGSPAPPARAGVTRAELGQDWIESLLARLAQGVPHLGGRRWHAAKFSQRHCGVSPLKE
jgi:hypothetical protein